MKNQYIKSPLNYVGGKYKLLDQIIPLFPNNISTFVDLFGGGFNVGINVDAKRVIYNETCTQVVHLLATLKNKPIQESLDYIDFIIEDYELSKNNKDGFLKLREDYNDDPDPLAFYTMICYAFNYQIRFNKNGKYNMPFGKNRSSFNPKMRENFIMFCDKLHHISCEFSNGSFEDFNFNKLTNNDFVYCDPPYFNSVASYNEQNGWTQDSEDRLLKTLDHLHESGIRFALSNNLKYDNAMLDKWKDKYTVHFLNGDYSNCNYHKMDKGKDMEVLITNY